MSAQCRPIRALQLLKKAIKVGHAPVIGDPAVLHAHRIDGLEVHFPPRRWDTEQGAPMRAVINLVGGDKIALVGGMPGWGV